MTTNRDWLFSLPLEDQYAWMNAEHQERALDGDAEPESEDSRERLEAEIESYSAFGIMDTITLDMVIGWLDRQAAITRMDCAKCAEGMGAYADGLCDPLKERIAELTAERERYREKFGKCIDYADAIHALMDEGLA